MFVKIFLVIKNLGILYILAVSSLEVACACSVLQLRWNLLIAEACGLLLLLGTPSTSMSPPTSSPLAFPLLSIFAWKTLDKKVVDFFPNTLASFTVRCSGFASRFQTGYLYHYAKNKRNRNTLSDNAESKNRFCFTAITQK